MAKANSGEATSPDVSVTASADATAPDNANQDVAGLSYEQARDELISIVAQLESGQLGLEESMRLWRRGEALAAHCSTWLDGAESALTGADEGQ